MDLSTILKIDDSFFAFWKFLGRKEESAQNQLMFCRCVGKSLCYSTQKSSTTTNDIHVLEDFNKRLMGENGESDVDELHQEAMTMYINYFEANAKHKVNVSQAIVDEIFTSKTFLSFFNNS